ncbi:pyruvate, water dikinase regulatory protein [Enterococcus quebecensis]|uniref:Putative pyruvate, phosphate dikinase regulatory protein n=1 Tax=Enterococcus quebecensis TaxID=903983 RepID=A0A1E5H1P3_9ENTE|nr:pyruvate, water dikinase regulatory protein [Enterococcus quebecensis]OEG18853.1 phosphoenolpyruvate synthase regulatory protein [Enterococcus quebecensis]
MKNDKIKIYLVSDSVGETAQKIISAVSAQYPSIDMSDIKRFPFITDEELLQPILRDALHDKAVVVTTLVDKKLVNLVADFAKRTGLQFVDYMSPLSEIVEGTFGIQPLQEPGAIHKLNEQYFSRVSAIEFAVRYDDGKDSKGFLEADYVLLGVSRTSKTPLSMYMANRNHKVANLPLIPEVALPAELDQIDPKKIIGLTTNIDSLMDIRKSRLHSLGLKEDSAYTNADRIQEELNYAASVFEKYNALVINVDKKSIEETTTIIENLTKNEH